MANQSAKRFQWTPLMTVITGLALVIVGGWIFVSLHHNPHGLGGTRIAGAPRSTQNSVNKTTPAYAKAVQNEDIQEAQKAAHSGATYIPPPAAQTVSAPPILSLSGGSLGGMSALNGTNGPPDTKQNYASTQSDGSAATPIMMGNAQNQGGANGSVQGLSPQGRAAKRDAAALKALMVRLRVPVPKTFVVKMGHKKTGSNGGIPVPGKPIHTGGSQTPLPSYLVSTLRPGAMLYAENDLYLDSDSPGPVEVTILAGPLTGARALGTMAKTGDYLTLKFSSITTKAGVTYAISGYGVNPKIPATTVRSAVNHHILSRWGGLLAASFLQGYGQAISQSGSTAATSYGSTVTTMPVLTPQQELLVAAGTVGQQLSSVMQANFNRPATVTLNPGVPLAILILKG